MEDVRASDSYAVRWARYGGHLNVVRWLVAGFGLTIRDVESFDGAALAMARQQGYPEMERWLIDTFGFAESRNAES